MTDFSTITLENRDGVGLITLNRPDRMNAFTGQMMLDLIKAFDITDADDSVRAVIVTGAGRAFCAGADLGGGGDTFNVEKRDMSLEETVNGIRRDGGGRVTLRIYESLKPVIAAINGAAVGIGVTMQLPMDFRLASTAAKFGFVFSRRGIVMEACSSWFLPRLVGVPTSLDWTYSGRVFEAQEAKDRGLVQSLHAPDDLLPAAFDLARRITDKTAPVSIALNRQMIWRNLGVSHPMEAHWVDSRGIQYRGMSADVKEGVTSFLEKRDPVFPDKVSTDLPDLFPEKAPKFK